MSLRAPKNIIKSNDDALATFVARKAEFDGILSRLRALNDDHFGITPDEITWDHVGNLGHYAELLKRTTDMALNGGEHAA